MRRSTKLAVPALMLTVLAFALTGCHPRPLVSMADAAAREGEPISFPVRLESNGAGNPNTAHGDVKLYCTTSDGSATAGADYLGQSDAHCGTIRAGATTTTVRVATLPDAEWETNEDFWLQLRVEGNAGSARTRASGLIN
jgi:hypothetical protein